MIRLPLSGALFGMIAFPVLAVAAPEPSDLATLRTAYQAQLDKTREQYLLRLEELVKAETKKGNIEGAVTVRDEITKLKANAPLPASGGTLATAGPIAIEKSPFYGSSWANDQSLLEFHKDGTWRSDYKGSVMTGTWQTTRDERLITLANWNNNPDMTFVLAKTGTRCLRTVDGYHYDRKDAIPGAVAAPPGGGSSNPFGNLR